MVSVLLHSQLLMSASSLFASLVSLDSNYLTHEHGYYHWTQVLFANGLIGACVVVIIDISQRCRGADLKRPSLLGRREKVPWLILRGIFGAVEAACAFVALTYMDMAEANAIMFTNPAFTGILACCLLGQRWRYFDYILTLSSFIGVLLVVRPGFIFGGRADADVEHAWQRSVGVLSAIGFALTLAGANLVINSKVRDETMSTVTFYMFVGVCICTLPAFAFVSPMGFFASGFSDAQTYMLLGIGLLFTVFQYTRTRAFQKAPDSSVVNFLYLEIAFAFVLDICILGAVPYWSSIAGASIIVLGSVAASWMKAREESRKNAPSQDDVNSEVSDSSTKEPSSEVSDSSTKEPSSETDVV